MKEAFLWINSAALRQIPFSLRRQEWSRSKVAVKVVMCCITVNRATNWSQRNNLRTAPLHWWSHTQRISLQPAPLHAVNTLINLLIAFLWAFLWCLRQIDSGLKVRWYQRFFFFFYCRLQQITLCKFDLHPTNSKWHKQMSRFIIQSACSSLFIPVCVVVREVRALRPWQGNHCIQQQAAGKWNASAWRNAFYRSNTRQTDGAQASFGGSRWTGTDVWFTKSTDVATWADNVEDTRITHAGYYDLWLWTLSIVIMCSSVFIQ